MYKIPQGDNPGTQQEAATTLESHATELDLPVFYDEPAITIQPQLGNDPLYPGSRRPIPVLSNDTSQFIPVHGLEFLTGAEQVYIQQTVELSDLLANVASENRYTVKIPRGDTIYYASETSTSFQRNCFGSGRSFSMRLFDQTRQEALHFKRRLACGTCSFWCYLQKMEIWLPPGEMIGAVVQEPAMTTPTFSVYNRHYNMIYRVEGPAMSPCAMSIKDAHFKIYTADGSTQIGAINHQWDQVQTAYILCVQFPANDNETRHKALLLGAAFLLEYMYFARGKEPGCCKCIC